MCHSLYEEIHSTKVPFSSQVSSHSAELDAKVVSLIADLAMARDSSASLERDNSELNARVSELEKSRANLDSELKTAQARL